MSKDVQIGLVNAATPTPLNAEGKIDRSSIKKLAAHWVNIGLDGVMVLGTMGEGRFLSDNDRDAMVTGSLEHAGDKLTVFATVADLSAARMIERAQRYAALGAPVAVVCVPPGSSPAAAIQSVKAVADASPIPIAYYDIPANTGVNLVLEQHLEILEHPNIVTMKDSSGNALLANAYTAEQFRPKCKLLCGNEYMVVNTCLVGFDGVLHGGGAMTGWHVRKTWETVLAGNVEEAIRMDRNRSICVAQIYNRFSTPLQNVLGQKYALHLLGAMDHAVDCEGRQLDAAAKKRVKTAVDTNIDWLKPY